MPEHSFLSFPSISAVMRAFAERCLTKRLSIPHNFQFLLFFSYLIFFFFRSAASCCTTFHNILPTSFWYSHKVRVSNPYVHKSRRGQTRALRVCIEWDRTIELNLSAQNSLYRMLKVVFSFIREQKTDLFSLHLGFAEAWHVYQACNREGGII